MKNSRVKAYMSLWRRRITHGSGGALTIALVLCTTSKVFAYRCPQNPPPARTETYQGFLGRVHELSGQQLPYRLFVPKDYDPKKA